MYVGEEDSIAQTGNGRQVSHPEYLKYKEICKWELKRMESN